MIKYHIGCGKRDFGKEWYHVDGADYSHIESTDVLLKGFTDNYADVIYSSHFIEYFDRNEVVELLEHWHRVLKPGGELFISVPDFEAICKLYCDKEYEIEQFLGLLYGRMQMNETIIYHKSVYDYKSLCRVLSSVGFTGINKPQTIKTDCGMRGHWSTFLPDDHSRAVLPHMAFDGTPVSLNVSCYKK